LEKGWQTRGIAMMWKNFARVDGYVLGRTKYVTVDAVCVPVDISYHKSHTTRHDRVEQLLVNPAPPVAAFVSVSLFWLLVPHERRPGNPRMPLPQAELLASIQAVLPARGRAAGSGAPQRPPADQPGRSYRADIKHRKRAHVSPTRRAEERGASASYPGTSPTQPAGRIRPPAVDGAFPGLTRRSRPRAEAPPQGNGMRPWARRERLPLVLSPQLAQIDVEGRHRGNERVSEERRRRLPPKGGGANGRP